MTSMRALDRKLLRDVARLWAQALAIALVVAGGVATMILAVGTMRSLDATRVAYYERYQFADVFATVRRAPNALADKIAAIPGVAVVDTRIEKLVPLDIPGYSAPATGQLISLPAGEQPTLNQLYLRTGRLPEQGKSDEVVVSEGFAKAHAFAPGDSFLALLNGRQRELVIVGTALSPEFVYTIGPGDRAPNEGRFAVIWIAEKTLASAYDLDGAFSTVNVKLLRNASKPEVIQRLDDLLDGYGGQAAYGRKNQTSDAYIDHGLDMFRNMSRTLPPIFLLVSAFLINLTLSRVVALEREQIGLLKALGYHNAAIAWHYIKFVLAIVVVGILIGTVVGSWLRTDLTRLYGRYYHFPFLVFAPSPDLYLLVGALSILAAAAGALHALREIVALPPAIAMQPPAPPRFHRLLPARLVFRHVLPQTVVMMLRNFTSHPVRALLTTVGMALATGILVASLFLGGTMEGLINVTFFLADRQDATVNFVEKRPESVMHDMARLPGVLAVEPLRQVPVRIRYGSVERRVILSGRPRDADLSRIIDTSLHPVLLPESGLAISAWLARILGVHIGDSVEVDLLEGQRRTVTLPVTALVEDYFGIQGMMDSGALARLLREAPAVTGVNLSLDVAQQDHFYAAIKRLPVVSSTILQRASLASFRSQMAIIVNTMARMYTALAAVIAFGVIYNSARISLSERARELASLRVLGFTQGEVLRMLLLELAFIVLLAQPAGWGVGYGLAWMLKSRMAGELMRAPLLVDRSTYLAASGIVMAAATFSGLVMRQRINRLDLVAVLKTRD